jgi:uncharacterized membrane protein
MTRLLALVSVLVAGAAAAQPVVLPSLYDVTGVAAGSVLNVRSGPGTGAPVIGTLAPDATGIEVVAVDASGGWAQHNLREGAGWSALRFLAEQDEVWLPGALPPGLSCLGTEPFWNLAAEDGTLVLEIPEVRREIGPLTALDTGIPGDVRRAVFATNAQTRITATITPEACSDGMSDRAFALGAMVVLEEEAAAPMLLTGCCSIAP